MILSLESSFEMKRAQFLFLALLICSVHAHIYIVPVPGEDGRFLWLPSSRRIVEVPKKEDIKILDKNQQVASLFDSRVNQRFLK